MNLLPVRFGNALRRDRPILNLIFPCWFFAFVLSSCASNEGTDREKERDQITKIIKKYNQDTAASTKLVWVDSIHRQLPDIKVGDTARIIYRFRNSGARPLMLYDVRPSCGCTVVEKPTAPIGPNEMGKITAVFHSYGKTGYVQKEISVLANTYPKSYSLSFAVHIK